MMYIKNTLKNVDSDSYLIGRAWLPGDPSGPCVLWIKNNNAFDLTNQFPTTSSLFETNDPIKELNKIKNLNSIGEVLSLIG